MPRKTKQSPRYFPINETGGFLDHDSLQIEIQVGVGRFQVFMNGTDRHEVLEYREIPAAFFRMMCFFRLTATGCLFLLTAKTLHTIICLERCFRREGKMQKEIETYINQFNPEIQNRLLQIRDVFFSVVPDATEAIKYQMPTIIWNGNLIHYAAFRKHIGIYPLPHVLELLQDDIKGYKTGKGSIQFDNDKVLPLEVIRKIIELRKRDKENEISKKKHKSHANYEK
jgi:uncharacterized protein YdhG (YjbR/CyaY superfamily)